MKILFNYFGVLKILFKFARDFGEGFRLNVLQIGNRFNVAYLLLVFSLI